MLIKVRGKVYSSANEPVMVVLSTQDKANIAQMQERAHKYCAFPDQADKRTIAAWMSELPEPEVAERKDNHE